MANLKPQTNDSGPQGSALFADWVDAAVTWVEAKTACPHCGKSIKIACDKEMDTLHIQKDQE